MDENWIEVHETAFVTSAYRASNEELSKDNFAKFWATPNTDKWIEYFDQSVSNEEAYAHCLRNRQFVEFISRNKQIQMVINFGCGFSMYPFILNTNIIHVEIDLPNIVEFKKSKVQDWIASGELPKRNIHFISTDFSVNYEEDLFQQLRPLMEGKCSLIILEGVLFFLTKIETNRLFNFFNSIQSTKDFIGSVSYQDEIRTTSVFNRLVDFFQDSAKEENFACQTLPDSFYTSLPSYELIEHHDYYSASKEFAPRHITKNEDNVLNEHIYFLRKL